MSSIAPLLLTASQGAIYLDSDLETVRRVYLSHFPLPADPLSLLQPDGSGGVPTSGSGSAWSGGGSTWGQG